MKRTSLILVAVLVLLVVVVGFLLLLSLHSQQPAMNTTSTNGNSFPISSSTQNSSGTTGGAVPTLNVKSTMGGAITTKDFIHNGTTAVDANNSDDYYLAGGPQYCSGGVCPSNTATPEYYITYRKSSNAFIIGLQQEPLGTVRKDAEQYLMNELGISQNQMCSLNYYVLTTSDVNPIYANENLGFSFCPGAVKLPGS